MKRFFLALMCAAMVFLGCSPLAAYQCRGGESGAANWHTVEARGLDSAKSDGDFGECRALMSEVIVGSEYAAERSERWTCTGYIQAPLTFHPWSRRVLAVRRGTSEFDVSGDETMLATMVRGLDVGIVGDIVATTSGTVKDDLTTKFRWELTRSFTRSFNTVNGPWRSTQRKHDKEFAFVAHCFKSQFDAPSESMWPSDNSDDFPRDTCFDWSAVEGRFVEVIRPEATRHICVKELHGQRLELNADGAKEPGSLFFPMRSQKHMCGPASHADSGINAALRNDVRGDYRLLDYVGACWEMGKPKPPNPGWSGHNGSW
jgi:hypothetical protein